MKSTLKQKSPLISGHQLVLGKAYISGYNKVFLCIRFNEELTLVNIHHPNGDCHDYCCYLDNKEMFSEYTGEIVLDFS